MSTTESDIPSKIESNIIKSYTQYKTVIITSVATGIIILASLAWNSVIQAIIEKYYPNKTDTIIGKIQYALIITLLVVLLQIYILSFFTDTTKKHNIVLDNYLV